MKEDMYVGIGIGAVVFSILSGIALIIHALK